MYFWGKTTRGCSPSLSSAFTMCTSWYTLTLPHPKYATLAPSTMAVYGGPSRASSHSENSLSICVACSAFWALSAVDRPLAASLAVYSIDFSRAISRRVS